LENVVQLCLRPETLRAAAEEPVEVTPITHELVVVLTQDCDLEQDYKRRQTSQQGSLPNVLLCDVYLAEVLRATLQRQDQLGRQDWKKGVAQNQKDRFHYLQRVQPSEDLGGEGLTALALDFKIYFTLPTDELYVRLVNGIRRRARLNTPYCEHLSHRFFSFQSRVALPQNHEIDPLPE